MAHPSGAGHRRLGWLAIAATAILASCAETRGPSQPSSAAVYSGVVRWLAARSATDPEPLPVFVESIAADHAIGVDAQVKVIDTTAGIATVRFVDSGDEAIVDADGTKAIKDGGVFVALGPVVARDQDVEVELANVDPASGEPGPLQYLTLRADGAGQYAVVGSRQQP